MASRASDPLPPQVGPTDVAAAPSPPRLLLAEASGEARGAASAAVGQKNTLEAPLRQVLRSLVLSIRANYPDEDTQRGVLRAFGFQKEMY